MKNQPTTERPDVAFEDVKCRECGQVCATPTCTDHSGWSADDCINCGKSLADHTADEITAEGVCLVATETFSALRIDESDENAAGEPTFGVEAPQGYLVVTRRKSGDLTVECISGEATPRENVEALKLVRERIAAADVIANTVRELRAERSQNSKRLRSKRFIGTGDRERLFNRQQAINEQIEALGECVDCGATRPCESCYMEQVQLDTTTEHPLGNIGDTTKGVGDLVSFEVAAPGCGRVTYKITRMENGEAFGTCVENNSRELTLEDVR